MGNPTKYKEEYATDEFVEQFVKKCKDDKVLVSLCRLAVNLKVCEDTIQEWGNVHKEFKAIKDIIKQISKDQLIQRGLDNTYNSKIAKLVLSSCHGMAEKREEHITGDTKTRMVVIMANDEDEVSDERSENQAD